MLRNPSVNWPSRLLLIGTVSAGALAARFAITEPGVSVFWPVLFVVAYALAASGVAHLNDKNRWFSKVEHGKPLGYSARGKALGAVLFVAPLVPCLAGLFGSTQVVPMEQAVIATLINVAFFLAAFPAIARNEFAALGISFILALAGLMLNAQATHVWLIVLHGGLIAIWLANRYWCHVSAVSANGARPAAPLWAYGLIVLVMTGSSFIVSKTAGGVAKNWGEWLPSSGGSQRANSSALLGAGDGDWAVSGPNARGTGAVDSDYFLESELSSMYDVMTDAYGEPIPPDQLFRAIFVDQEQFLDRDGHKAPDFGEAGRQFSLYRESIQNREQQPSVDAKALLYVEGGGPLHLCTTIYDSFDGICWHEPPVIDHRCHLESHDPDHSWLWLMDRPVLECLDGCRFHTLRFGTLSTDRVPLPSYLERFRLGKAGGANAQQWAMETFAWVYDGVIRARHCLPSGSFFEVASQSIDESKLALVKPALFSRGTKDVNLEIPKHLTASAANLAHQFENLPKGWPQIQGLTAHLRQHYAHDRDASLPPTCDDPIHYLLHQARGGPDYQFATTAALALRSLGYPTRVVSGFYVDPKKYVAAAGFTPVTKDDAHFWVEVKSTDGGWVKFDPTPGFDLHRYRPTLLGSVVNSVAQLWAFAAARPVKSCLLLAVLVASWWRRWWIVERCFTMRCLLAPFRNQRACLSMTLRLLDLRSRLAGAAREPHVTPRDWYGGRDDAIRESFLTHLYAASYGCESSTTESQEGVVTDLCRKVVRHLSRQRLKRTPTGE